MNSQPTDADHVGLSSGRVKPEHADAADARLSAGYLKILQEGEPQPTDADHVRLSPGRVKPEPADAGDSRLLAG